MGLQKNKETVQRPRGDGTELHEAAAHIAGERRARRLGRPEGTGPGPAAIQIRFVVRWRNRKVDETTDPILGEDFAFGGQFLPEAIGRSEEHTSELQSLRHLVCRL